MSLAHAAFWRILGVVIDRRRRMGLKAFGWFKSWILFGSDIDRILEKFWNSFGVNHIDAAFTMCYDRLVVLGTLGNKVCLIELQPITM